ncbi:hypothetical protein [Streptomyces sp. TR06-5]|uniref:hypothetical protein n=1 Tax=unclassified Streptomyces TaxID=2593676 RepID=UPI0039A02558
MRSAVRTSSTLAPTAGGDTMPSPLPRPRSPHPGPDGTTVPRYCAVPDFPPIAAGPGRGLPRLRRVLSRRRRLLVLGLALSTVGAAGAAARTAGPLPAPEAGAARAAPAAPAAHRVAAGSRDGPAPGGRPVSVPVRLADADTVRLLRAGDRIDVMARASRAGGERPGAARSEGAAVPRVVARCVPVAEVPAASKTPRRGALVVLRVPRRTAAELVGAAAGAGAPPAVSLC